MCRYLIALKKSKYYDFIYIVIFSALELPDAAFYIFEFCRFQHRINLRRKYNYIYFSHYNYSGNNPRFY